MKVRNYYFTESILTFIFVISSIGLLSKIPLGDFFNPVSKMFGDFQLSDVVFSHIRENKNANEKIVLVNIGDLSRGGIAEQINILRKHNPKVIGIDAFFRKPRHSSDPEEDKVLVQEDSMLVDAFSRTQNLIIVSELIEDQNTSKIETLKMSHPMFVQHAYTGFADMISEGRDVFKTARECIPKEKIGDSIVLSFPTFIAKLYDEKAVEKYLNRDNEIEIINFEGNIDTRTEGVSGNSKTTFFALDAEQVLNEQFEPEIIKDKIILMGYMGSSFTQSSWTDKFFTPLNANYVGKTYPDMYGVVVHANVVSMILRGEFIDEMNPTLNLSISLVLIFFFIWFLTFCFYVLKDWYDGGSNIVTLILVCFLMFLNIEIFNKYNFKIDLSYLMVATFLSGNLVEIYQGVIKMGYITIKEKIVTWNNKKLKSTEQL
ncbi:MAG: CHASE2 domain-containing protein [Cytophagales bacterium]|nr:MAG: CHASE2 domain-containing protein [Cytophagales bacterium]